MTVKELIEHLQTIDPNIDVLTTVDGEARKITYNEIYTSSYYVGEYKEVILKTVRLYSKPTNPEFFKCLVLEG